MSIRALFLAPLLVAACGPQNVQGEADGVRTTQAEDGAVWFGPNVGSPDLLDLFRDPSAWARTRDTVSVFQLYAQQTVNDPAACPTCGDNILPNLAAVDAFGQLGRWGKKIAVENGSIKWFACDADSAAKNTDAVVRAIEDHGGQVAYLSMDEPYVGGAATVNGRSCGQSMQQTAAQVARYIQLAQAAHPGTRVGDVEPYPYYSVDQLLGWIDEVGRDGARPAYFHLDVDRNDAKNRRSNVAGDLARLRSELAARGIPFGVIFWGQEIDLTDGANADQVYHDKVMGWVSQVHAAIGAPDQSVFQSWAFIDGQNAIPHNLPEAGYGHTRLIDDGWALLAPQSAPPQQPPPNGPPPSSAASVQVEHGYRGILGRAADPSGLALYSQKIASGQLSLLDFCRALAGSPEFAQRRGGLSPSELAEALYQGILERPADAGGLASSSAEIAAGHLAEVAAGMLSSPEFAQRFLSP